MLKRLATAFCIAVAMMAAGTFTANAQLQGPAPEEVELLKSKSNYFGHEILTRNENGLFTSTNPRLRELSAYLNTLNLPPSISKILVVMSKSLVEYEPIFGGHDDKPWFVPTEDGAGVIVDPKGDGGVLRNTPIGVDAWLGVQRKIWEFMEQYWYGPHVLIEGKDEFETTEGNETRLLVDLGIKMFDADSQNIGSLEITHYRLPTSNDPIDLDNVDAGNENWEIQVAYCGADSGTQKNADRVIGANEEYYPIGGGTAPLTGRRKAALRYEWDMAKRWGFISSEGGSGGFRMIEVGGESIYGEGIYVVPKLDKPIVVVHGGRLHIVLPQYIEKGVAPAYVAVECTGNDSVVNVRMVRGGVQKNFETPISRNPDKIPGDNRSR